MVALVGVLLLLLLRLTLLLVLPCAARLLPLPGLMKGMRTCSCITTAGSGKALSGKTCGALLINELKMQADSKWPGDGLLHAWRLVAGYSFDSKRCPWVKYISLV